MNNIAVEFVVITLLAAPAMMQIMFNKSSMQPTTAKLLDALLSFGFWYLVINSAILIYDAIGTGFTVTFGATIAFSIVLMIYQYRSLRDDYIGDYPTMIDNIATLAAIIGFITVR